MYSVSINNEIFKVEKDGEGLLVNGAPLHWDLKKINSTTFHILLNQVSHSVELLNVDNEQKLLTIKINNKVTSIYVKDRFDLLLEKLGMNKKVGKLINDIKAPMPGLILDIRVEVGDSITKGDPLLVLEAMKMENILKSANDGVVKAILVGKGDSVEKNQVLIQF